MKVKMKFDLAAIKGGLLAHGEKLVFGVIVLAFAMFTWGAVKREVLDVSKQPDVLKQKAQDVRAYVERSTWEPKREGIEVIDYIARAKREDVLATNYPFPTRFSPPLADDKAKRDDPNFFGVEELRAASGISIFELKGAGAGGGAVTLKAQPWVAITGLVPLQKQTQEYARVFQNAMGDMKRSADPEYTAIIVHRAEDVGRELTDADFKPILVPVDFREKWNGRGEEIVNKLYIDENLTAPLAPLAAKAAWDQSVGHPRIPLAEDKPGQAPAAAQAGKDEDKDKDQPAADAAVAPAGRVRFGQAPPPAPNKADARKSGSSETPEIAYKLLRVFDYSVEAKKKYKYRVALVVKNPNFGQQAYVLRNPESGKNEEMQTAMSAPTDLVATPTGYRVLAAGLAVKSLRTDPSAKIMVSKIDPKEGLEPAGEMEVSRGSMANFSAKELRVVNPLGGVKPLSDVEIKTGVLVLDVHGGRPLTPKKSAASPLEVLILDSESGSLSVRNELDDLDQVVKRQVPEEPSTRKADPLGTPPPKARPKPKKSR